MDFERDLEMNSVNNVRIGVIGAGWFATANHIPVLARRPDVELTAVCRLGQNELKTVQEAFGFRFATEDYRELLEQNLDGVIVSSPHDLHYEHAAAALRKGLHVVCEKPMTLDPSEAWDLVRLADQHARHLLVPYGWNYKPFVGEARDLLNSGAVGEIEHVMCRMASPTKSFFAGSNSTVPAAWAPTITAPEPETWQSTVRGGGYGYGQITHIAGLLFWLTELRALRVACLMTAPHSKVDMYNSAIVEFASGAIGSISGAATLPDGLPFQLQLQVFGDAGVLSLDAEAGREQVSLTRHDHKDKKVRVPCGEGAYSCADPIDTFIELIQGGGTNRSPGHVAARSVELVEAMHRSARNGGCFACLAAGTTSNHL
jgi:predicted dehydrogenase